MRWRTPTDGRFLWSGGRRCWFRQWSYRFAGRDRRSRRRSGGCAAARCERSPDAQLERLDLIKIDVEGLEWPVLRGGSRPSPNSARYRVRIRCPFSRAGRGAPRVLPTSSSGMAIGCFAIGRNWAQAVASRPLADCADLWAIPSERTRQPPGGVAASAIEKPA